MAASSQKRLPRDFFDDAAPFRCDGIYCKLIPLTQGQFALVWLEDYVELSKVRWGAQWDTKMQSFYATRAITLPDGKETVLSMHRQILGLKFGDKRQGDHALHDTLDNRRKVGEKVNLRIVSQGQNKCNGVRYRNSTTGFKGVHQKGGDFVARIQINGKRVHLGRRKTAEAAHRELYVPAALKLHGEFARVA